MTATIVTSTSRIEPSALVSHGPRRGERKKPGAERAGRGGARVGDELHGVLTTAERYERAAADARGSPRREARPAPRPRRRSTPTRAQRNHSDTTSGASSRTASRLRRRSRRIDLDDDRAAGREQLAGPPSSSAPGRPPIPMLPSSSRIVRQVPARGTSSHSEPLIAVGAAPARERARRPARDRRRAPRLPARAQRGEMAARAAAEVEHRRLDAGEDRAGRPRRRARASGRAGAARARRRRSRIRAARAGRRRRACCAARREQTPVERSAAPSAGAARSSAAGSTSVMRRSPASGAIARTRPRSGVLGRLGGDARARPRTCRRRAAAAGSPGARPSARRRARWTAPVRRVLIGTPAKTRRRPACAGRCPSSRRRAPAPNAEPPPATRREARVEQLRRDLRRVHADQEGGLADVLERGRQALVEPVTALRDDLEARGQPRARLAVEHDDPAAGARASGSRRRACPPAPRGRARRPVRACTAGSDGS